LPASKRGGGAEQRACNKGLERVRPCLKRKT